MAELKLRSSAATSISKLVKKLEAGELAELDLAMKRATLDNLGSHFTRFVDAHFLLVGSAKETEMEAHSTLFEEVEDKYTKVKAMLTAAIDLAVQEQQASEASVVRSVHVQQGDLNDLRLEKIVIPEFNGEFNKWIAFRDMFEAMVHSKEHLSTAAKYTRLMRALKGSAAQVVAGFLPTDDNYESAWQTLKARYDNDRLIVSAHLSIFLNMDSIEKETNTGLRRVVDITNETTRSLAAMKRPVETWDDILVHILASKLPRATIIHWEMQLKGTELPKLAELLVFIEGRARGLDHMGSAMNDRTYNSGNSVNKRLSSTPKAHVSTGSGGASRLTRTNLPSAGHGHCYYCNGDHYIGRCPNLEALSAAERFGHATRVCLSKHRCGKCQGMHHTILCRTVTSNKTPTVGASTVASPPQTLA
ncbi:uncharacterized protein LOC129948461 [Eupeodes corollae]|uniref:uncharacterized protein LOC129948461 n=1 Tax=Eupeodes corollae TaxID=290404 RepID=UPI0024933A88|nr:uncharacterized protein LOC129948461 [Eupeodes corollae]